MFWKTKVVTYEPKKDIKTTISWKKILTFDDSTDLSEVIKKNWKKTETKLNYNTKNWKVEEIKKMLEEARGKVKNWDLEFIKEIIKRNKWIIFFIIVFFLAAPQLIIPVIIFMIIILSNKKK